jgi:hypothetical protein
LAHDAGDVVGQGFFALRACVQKGGGGEGGGGEQKAAAG